MAVDKSLNSHACMLHVLSGCRWDQYTNIIHEWMCCMSMSINKHCIDNMLYIHGCSVFVLACFPVCLLSV